MTLLGRWRLYMYVHMYMATYPYSLAAFLIQSWQATCKYFELHVCCCVQLDSPLPPKAVLIPRLHSTKISIRAICIPCSKLDAWAFKRQHATTVLGGPGVRLRGCGWSRAFLSSAFSLDFVLSPPFSLAAFLQHSHAHHAGFVQVSVPFWIEP